MSEREPLLNEKGASIKENSSSQRTWRHFLLLPVLFFHFAASGLHSYVINEWTQSVVKENILGNRTLLKNVSACHDTNHSSPEYAMYVQVQQETAMWQTYYTVSIFVTALVSASVLPSYTDVYGRKFLINLTLFGYLIKMLVCTFVIYYRLAFIYVLVGNAIEGITGAYYGLLSAAFSFVADITPTRQERTLSITVIEGMMLASSVLTGIGAGIYIQYAGFLYPMITSTCLTGMSFLLSILVLPETLIKSKARRIPSVTQNFRRITDLYISKDFKGQRCAHLSLLLAFGFCILTSGHRSTLETIYQLGMPFCWSPSLIGYFAAVRHAAMGLLGVGSLRFLQRCFADVYIAMFSVVSNAGSYVLEAFASTDITMFIVPVVAIFSFLTIPLIRSMMSLMTPEDRQGAVFASIALIEVIGGVCSTLIGNSVYSATVGFMHGFVFLVLAGMNITTFFLLVWYAYLKKDTHPEESVNVDAKDKGTC